METSAPVERNGPGQCDLDAGDLAMLSDFFRNLGQNLGRSIHQASWLGQALTGTDEERIQAESVFGRDLAREVRVRMRVAADPQPAAWLDEIGTGLAARVAKSKKRPFTFTLLDAGAPNAFAVPGGFIFIERSLLDLCGRDKHETAFVLGHEMAHVIRWHAIDRVLAEMAVAQLPIRGAAGMILKRLGPKLVSSAYSQDQEFDADALGARLAEAAGYDPGAGPRLLERLGPADAKAQRAPLAIYFASHPPISERVARLRRVIRS
jgi:beta-barrel assembly-enhancing protease